MQQLKIRHTIKPQIFYQLVKFQPLNFWSNISLRDWTKTNITTRCTV